MPSYYAIGNDNDAEANPGYCYATPLETYSPCGKSVSKTCSITSTQAAGSMVDCVSACKAAGSDYSMLTVNPKLCVCFPNPLPTTPTTPQFKPVPNILSLKCKSIMCATPPKTDYQNGGCLVTTGFPSSTYPNLCDKPTQWLGYNILEQGDVVNAWAVAGSSVQTADGVKESVPSCNGFLSLSGCPSNNPNCTPAASIPGSDDN